MRAQLRMSLRPCAADFAALHEILKGHICFYDAFTMRCNDTGGRAGQPSGRSTTTVAKPAVPFGGKYRIIDFPLSNCANSSITTVGVLTQYQPLELNTYIGSGQPWDMDRTNGGVYVLPPFVRGNKGEGDKGTANAIYQNTEFIEQFRPEYVLILSGDHIYKMDYRKMLRYHISKNADATIAVINVPLKEASRYGIMSADAEGRIYDFTEKPKQPKSTLASMGVYIFRWSVLKSILPWTKAMCPPPTISARMSFLQCSSTAAVCMPTPSTAIGRMSEPCAPVGGKHGYAGRKAGAGSSR